MTLLKMSVDDSQNQKVVVAMSGGVDSSVAAALLKRAGFNVTGVFMKLSNTPGDALSRAKSVAQTIGIPFRVLDLRKEFQKRVIGIFLKEYKEGRTPNPCVICNKEVKFGLLMKKARTLGADFLATGHYISLKNGRLFKAKDESRDQSYFLWRINQKQLQHVLFPIGDFTKTETRALARKFKLPVAETPASQEICFISGDINDFLKDYFHPQKGKIFDVSGKVLGEHQGLIFYTIGQRKGIMLPQGPYWVKDKDFKNNILIVTKNEKDLLKKELRFKNVNWLSGKIPKMPLKIKAKIRSRSALASTVVYQNNRVVFTRSQRAITPGQSVVFYRGQELIGGGIIC
ncbi:MAG: tRNA 2-thiouridine(34) synthase MnmA [Candidatus Nealsonbacteria bacterium]